MQTGLHQIDFGQKVIADPNPATCTVNGRIVPAIQIKGVDKETFFMQTRGLDSSTLISMVRKFQDKLRLNLAKDLAGLSTSKAVAAKMKQMVADVATDDKLANDMPIRGYLSIWLPWYTLKLVQAGSVAVAGQTTQWTILLLQELLRALRHVEVTFSNVVNDYESALPHDLAATRSGAFQGSAHENTVHAASLTLALSNTELNRLFAAGSAPAATAVILRAQARLDLFAQESMQILYQELQNWLSKWTIGTALSSPPKGGALDILVGRNH